jgi:hypothetical protein
MLTRAKLKAGEGKLKTFNPEIGRATRGRKMEMKKASSEHEKNFHKIFLPMSDMVEKLFADYEKRVAKKEKKKKVKEEDNASVNHGIGGDPPEPPSPSSSSISSSSSSHSHHSQFSSF